MFRGLRITLRCRDSMGQRMYGGRRRGQGSVALARKLRKKLLTLLLLLNQKLKQGRVQVRRSWEDGCWRKVLRGGDGERVDQ